jgi:hypothetical protein
MTGAPGPGVDTSEPMCNDPMHDEYCDCGARPDYEYERRMEVDDD